MKGWSCRAWEARDTEQALRREEPVARLPCAASDAHSERAGQASEGSLPGRGEAVCCTARAEGMRPPQGGGKARKGEDGPLKDFGGRKDEA